MVLVTSYQYDGGNDGGDGNLTRQVQQVDAINGRVTDFVYDWRNRRTATDGELDYYQSQVYDNLNRIAQTERRDTTASGNLVSRDETRFDALGRVYQTLRYAVDTATGTVGNALTTDRWFDAAGNPVKTIQGGAGPQAFTKQTFDSLARVTASYSGYGTDSTYADVFTVTGDVILSQSETVYDDAGSAIQVTSRSRYHNAPASQAGPLGDPSTTPNARVTFSASYPDPLGRVIANVDYGTNGGAAFTRAATVPASSDTVLVSQSVYNDAGELEDEVDPAGKVLRTLYDAAGRTIKTIDNF
ncbi:hypothetical protein, partial [Roseimaritima sediminicola]|uniref:hypothetical protein n=1 Tax=Roseimaritima sediminicola TaxID=2662066 RepID=UPI00192A4C34